MAQIPQSTIDKAARINTDLAARADVIRSNPETTADAKVRNITRAYFAAEKEMAALKDGHDEADAQAERDLVRDAFGSVSSIGADAISARDADDRVAQLESAGDALALLQRSESNGDAVLSRAIALRAFNEVSGGFFGKGDPAWSPVLEGYVMAHPAAAGKMSLLVTARRSSPVTAGFTFYVAKPVEMERLGPVEQLAIQTEVNA